MFCPKCGLEQADDSNFCISCGENLGNKLEVQDKDTLKGLREITVPKPKFQNKLVLGLIAVVILVLVGGYAFAAYMPPSLTKAAKAMDKVSSYKQELTISMPYNSQFHMASEIDNRQNRSFIKVRAGYDKINIYTEPSRIIIGHSDYPKGYAAVNWEQGVDENSFKNYLTYIEQDVNDITRIIKNKIIKPKINPDFKKDTIRMPNGDNVKVKQYSAKLSDSDIADIIYDTANHLSTDIKFRDNIYSIVSKTIDFINDTYGDALDDYDRDSLQEANSQIIEAIDEFCEYFSENALYDEIHDEMEGFSLDYKISYDYKNRPIEFYLDIKAPEGNIKIKNSIYAINQPIDIVFPDEMDIVERLDLSDLMWMF